MIENRDEENNSFDYIKIYNHNTAAFFELLNTSNTDILAGFSYYQIHQWSATDSQLTFLATDGQSGTLNVGVIDIAALSQGATALGALTLVQQDEEIGLISNVNKLYSINKPIAENANIISLTENLVVLQSINLAPENLH